MGWNILDTGEKSAEENMRLDEELLGSLKEPTLHFYEWKENSATYGYFIDPGKFLNLQEAQKNGLTLARRPTGGGIVFHQWDLAFSVLVPASSSFFSLNTLENYAFVNQAVLNAIKEFLHNSSLELTPNDFEALDVNCNRFCMAKPTKYDVILEGKKVAGAAQRKRKEGFLHQGTIALVMPSQETKDILLSERVWDAMLVNTSPLLGKSASKEEMKQAKKELKRLLQKHIT